MAFKIILYVIAFLLAISLAAPVEKETKDLEGSQSEDLQTAASHYGGYGYGGYGHLGGYGHYGGYGHWGGYYPQYGYGWGYPSYGWYGHGWPYYYGNHGYWW